MSKRCGKCKKEKDRTEFHNIKASSDGLAYYCKQCMKSYAKNRNQELGPRRVEVTEFPENKVCTMCHEDKSLDEYYKSSNSKDGHAWKCISCSKELGKIHREDPVVKEETKRRQKERDARVRAERTPTERRDFYLKSRHGIGIEQYKELYDNQDGCCAICGKYQEFPGLFIDHDHNKGCHPMKATSCEKCRRGLLCSECNIGIAYLKDSSEILLSARNYILKLL